MTKKKSLASLLDRPSSVADGSRMNGANFTPVI
jgi:hypothetical protein